MIKKHIFLVIALIMIYAGLHAQWIERNYIRRNLKIHTDTSVINFEIIEDEVHIKPVAEYTYYWYANRKIMSNKGGIGGYVLDGPYIRYNRKDCLMENGTFKRGLKWGEWKLWDDKGNLRRIEPYKNGLLDGKVTVFDHEGKKQILTYKKGIQKMENPDSKAKTKDPVEIEESKTTVNDTIKEPSVATDSVTMEPPVAKKRKGFGKSSKEENKN